MLNIVKQSVMGAAEEAYSLAKVHPPVEKAIESSGSAWTSLRPNSFMQNAVTFMGKTIRTEGAFYSASVTGREQRRFAEYVREAATTGVWDVEADEVTR